VVVPALRSVIEDGRVAEHNIDGGRSTATISEWSPPCRHVTLTLREAVPPNHATPSCTIRQSVR
jgi:hypothetical protein